MGRRSAATAVALAVLVLGGAGCSDTKGAATASFVPAADGVLTVAAALPAPGFWDGDTPASVAGGFEHDLAEALAGLNWRLALPCSERLDAPVVFRAWKPGDPLVPDAVGIQAPQPTAEPLDPDIIVAPLLGFDRAGGRLGQGGGYYDRTLAEHRRRPDAPAFVGLAFSIQEVGHVPVEPHDQRLDGILTEKEYIAVRKDF